MNLPEGFTIDDEEETKNVLATLPEGFDLDQPETSPLVKTAVKSVSTEDVPAAPQDESIRDAIMRFLTRTYSPSGYKMEDQLALTPGKAGPSRFLEEQGKKVGSAVREAESNLMEKFVELPGVRAFPKTAAGVAATRSAGLDMISDSLTPSSQAQMLGGEGLLRWLKGLELAARGRVGAKISGLPSRVERAIKENPEFFEKTKGTPEEIKAANTALLDIIEKAKQEHIGKTTAARETERAGQLGEVESGVRNIQDVINKARAEAGQKYGETKQALGLERPLEERAGEIAKSGIRELKEPEVIRQALGALDPRAPRGKESIANLLRIRQDIDNLVTYSRKGVKPVPSEVEAVLMELRGRINDRIGGVTEPTFKRSVMGAEYGEPVGKNDIGAQLREADKAFSETAKAVEGLTPKFETVPKGVSTLRAQAGSGLRSIDPEVAALEKLAGGREALGRAEGAVSAFDTAEGAFKENLKKFDPLTGKFENPVKGADTVRSYMDKGLEKIEPDVETIKSIPKGGEALDRLKAEVNRFDAERVDVQPDNMAEVAAQIIGITPQRAARWLSQSVHGGTLPELSNAAAMFGRAAANGPKEMATQHFILMQNDESYRQAMKALQEAGK